MSPTPSHFLTNTALTLQSAQTVPTREIYFLTTSPVSYSTADGHGACSTIRIGLTAQEVGQQQSLKDLIQELQRRIKAQYGVVVQIKGVFNKEEAVRDISELLRMGSAADFSMSVVVLLPAQIEAVKNLKAMEAEMKEMKERTQRLIEEKTALHTTLENINTQIMQLTAQSVEKQRAICSSMINPPLVGLLSPPAVVAASERLKVLEAEAKKASASETAQPATAEIAVQAAAQVAPVVAKPVQTSTLFRPTKAATPSNVGVFSPKPWKPVSTVPAVEIKHAPHHGTQR